MINTLSYYGVMHPDWHRTSDAPKIEKAALPTELQDDKNGGLRWTCTINLRIKSPLLYSLSYQTMMETAQGLEPCLLGFAYPTFYLVN